MFESLVVYVVVGLAAVFAVRTLWPRRKAGCGGDCACGKVQGPDAPPA